MLDLICLASLRIKLVRSLLLKILVLKAFVYITSFACVTSACASANTTLNKKPKISKGRHHVTEVVSSSNYDVEVLTVSHQIVWALISALIALIQNVFGFSISHHVI